MSDDPAKALRFPFVGALLCAACLGAAAWTWMRYSYAWHVTPAGLGALLTAENLNKRHYKGRLWISGLAKHRSWPVDSFVRVRAQWLDTDPPDDAQLLVDTVEGGRDYLHAIGNSKSWQFTTDIESAPDPDRRWFGERWFYGRLVPDESTYGGPFGTLSRAPPGTPIVDTQRGRLHGATIAGLVVGAMGVFVFAVALRHWLGERRKLREEARA